LDDPVSYRSILVASKARRDQDNARVPRIRRDRFAREYEKVDDVSRHDRSGFSGCVIELSAVSKLAIADFKSVRRVYAAPPEKQGNIRRQVLIEIDLHREKRTSPGCCFSIASGVSAAFASIRA